MSDDDIAAFRSDMEDFLNTTIVLDGNERLKHIELPWNSLSEEELNVAADVTRSVAERELREHPEARITFEFDVVPEPFSRELEPVARKHSKFKYGPEPQV
jgi:hypothetical protein